jgi:hemerythrin
MMPAVLPVEQPAPTLDTSGIDATHRALAGLIEAAVQADGAAFPACFQALLALLRRHVAEEGGLMRASRYPGIAEHESEHHRVLGELMQLNRSLKRGRIALVRTYVKEGMGPWLDLHLATMDAALMAYLRSKAG